MFLYRFRMLVLVAVVLSMAGGAFALEEEWLCGYRMFPPKLQDGVYPHHYRPDRTVDFERLKLDIKILMDEMRVEGTAHYTFLPIHDQVDSIRFDAFEMEIEEVLCSGDVSVDWNTSDNSLYVNFPEALPMGQSQTVSITFSAEKVNAGGRFGGGMMFTNSKQVAAESADQMFTLDEPFGASAWFPCGDYPNDRLVTEINVTVPKEFVTLSNGLLTGSTDGGEWRTDHWKQKIPHVTYLVSLVVGHFDIVRDEWRGIPVEYYVEKGKAKDARPSMGKTPDMIEFFSNYLDYPYPYEKYAQVAVRYFTAGGMEHTTATTMHEWIVMDENARQDTDMEGLIMHELAHQWFGDLITCQSWGELWLNEGFATLSDALWDEHSKGKDAYLEAMLGKMQSYIGSSRSYTRAIVTNLFEDAGEMFDGHSYPKGACVLHMLRQQLGDDLFRKSIHHYLEANAPGLVDTDDLMESIETVTGRPMDRFFEQWVFRPGHPKMEVTHEWLDKQKQIKITLKQTQKMDEGDMAFAFPLEIEVRTEDDTLRETVEISKKEESVFIDCPKAPKSVNVNPELKVLMVLDHKKKEDMLLYDLEHGSSIIVRIRAIGGLTDNRSKRVREALLKAAREDSYLRIRLDAIGVLGKDRSPETLDALLTLIDDPEPEIRSKVINAMGGFHKEDKAIDALTGVFRNDSSNNVRAAAARVLARLEPGQSLYTLLKSGLTTKSWNHRLLTSVMNALVDLEDARVFNDLVKYSQDPHDRGVRTTAIRGMGRLAEKHNKYKNKTLDLLLGYLKSSSDSIRRSAISGLQSLKEEDAIDQLRWVERNDGDEGIRDAAGRAISEIRRDKQSDLAGKNAGRIDKLEDQKKEYEETNKKLEERLKDLEEKLKALTEKKESEKDENSQKEDSKESGS